MPARMQLVRDDDRQIRFANPWKWGLVISLVGLLIWWLIPLKATKSFSYWVAAGGVAFAVVVGVLAFLSRDEFVLDLSSRAYIRRRGYWPTVKEQRGPLNDFRALLLATELRSNPRGGQYPTWVITLQSSGVEPNVALVELRDETEAYDRLESWSRRLGFPAFEGANSGDHPLEFKPVARQHPLEPRATQIPSLPAGSRLLFFGSAPTRMIVLPPLGLSLGASILGIFSAITLWMGIAGYDEALHHIPPRNTSFAVGMIGLGILMVIALCFAIFSRTTVREKGDRILIGSRTFGWTYNVKSFAKRDIETVEIKPTSLSSGAPVFTLSGMRILRPRPPRPRAELFVRSRSQVVRIGQELAPQDLHWLEQALQCLAGT